jgi:hypothetical protein
MLLYDISRSLRDGAFPVFNEYRDLNLNHLNNLGLNGHTTWEVVAACELYRPALL